MDKKILIFGNNYLGLRLKEEFQAPLCSLEINSLEEAQGQIKKLSPQIVINCVEHLKRNVDDCELDKNKTLFANTFFPFILAEAALRNNIRFIHISSGCLFHYDYQKDLPLDEEVKPNFFDLFYSRSKIYSEQGLLPLVNKYPVLLLRIRVPLDNRPDPRNLLTKLVNYKKVIDLPNSVTYIPDFITALKHLIRIEAKGIYNIVNRNPLKYERLVEVYKKHVPDFQYETIEFNKLNSIRTNLVLSTEKLEKSGFRIRDISEVLEECVQEYLKY